MDPKNSTTKKYYAIELNCWAFTTSYWTTNAKVPTDFGMEISV